MKTILLSITGFAVLCLMLIGLMLVGLAEAKSAPVFQSFDVARGGTLELVSDAGDLQIESHTKDTVEVTVENNSDNDNFTVNFKQTGSDVTITGDRKKRSWWGSSSNIRFTIKVPDQYNLTLKTGGGSISLSDLKGQVNARTSGGSIYLGKIIGDVTVKTSGGSIRVDEVAGNINAHTSGGSIKATLTQQPKSNCRLTTSGGSLTAYLDPNVAVNLSAKTSGGRVHNEFEVNGNVSETSIEGKINGGGPELYMRTSGGSVSIKKI
jgi:DUF4097 and DUF4098 domain-containing protein YvlB